MSVDAEIVDYTTWTKDELVALRGMLSDEGARPEAADAVDHEIRRRETELATSSDLSSEQDSGEHRSFRPREPGEPYAPYPRPPGDTRPLAPGSVAAEEERYRLRIGLVLLVVISAAIATSGFGIFGSAAPTAVDVAASSDQAASCRAAAGLAIDIAAASTSRVEMAGAVTQAVSICESAMDALLDGNEDLYFGAQSIKSGLNALLAYIDTGVPSKFIEARDKIEQGNAYIAGA